jgi:hypothetical protein
MALHLMTFTRGLTGDRYQELYYGLVTRWFATDGAVIELPADCAYGLKTPDVSPPVWYVPLNPPAPEEPIDQVAELVSRRQFYEALARSSTITNNQALAAATGSTVPPALASIVTTLPTAADRNKADLILLSEPYFSKTSELMEFLGRGLGWTRRQGDTFWRLAGQL